MSLLRKLNALLKIPTKFKFSSHIHSFAVESDMNFMLENIGQMLSCNKKTAKSVYHNFPSICPVTTLRQIKENIDLLKQNGVSKELIAENPFLISLEFDALQRKLETIKRMRPRHIDDFVPLLQMKESILREVAVITAKEYEVIPETNRIYYLSKELQIPPATVSKYCSKSNLIFLTSFTSIAKKLNVLLDYNVDGNKILKSLYIFRCSEKVFISRLEEILSNGLYFIKPWYFKCTDEKFQKVLVSETEVGKEALSELARKFTKRNLKKLNILNELNVMLSCDDIISAQIYYNFIDNIDQLALAKKNIELLIDNGVSLEFVRTNAVVLILPNAQINENIELIKEMGPKSIEDFLPLVEVDTSTLRGYTRNVCKRPNELPDMHPIYVFSTKLNISPTIVSKYFAKHSQLFFGDFIGLQRKLDLLVSHNVQPMSILKSPLTFKMSFETLESALKNLKSQGIENISSWMLVGDTSRMKAVFARRFEEKRLLRESANTVDYVTKRLNWDDATKERALKLYPPLDKCSVIKVKQHLDYLLNETHFTIDDINSNVAVFRTKLDELKSRMNELASIGLVPRKLYIICLDRNRYLKFVRKFCWEKNCPATFEMFNTIEKRIKK